MHEVFNKVPNIGSLVKSKKVFNVQYFRKG